MLYCWFRAVVLFFTYASTLDEWYAYEQYDAATRLMYREPVDYAWIKTPDDVWSNLPPGVYYAAKNSLAWRANFTARAQALFPNVKTHNFQWGAPLTADLYASGIFMSDLEEGSGVKDRRTAGWWYNFMSTAICFCKQYRRDCNPVWAQDYCNEKPNYGTFDDMRDAMAKGGVAYHPDDGHAIFPGRSR
jgi:hypothetical protein